jgi:hypothetical protein
VTWDEASRDIADASIDTPMLGVNTEIGDHCPGATVTTGKTCFTGSFDDLMYSEMILLWGGNPNDTQIPNAHFINEARHSGARIVSIAPEDNSSSIHVNEWIPVKRLRTSSPVYALTIRDLMSAALD